MAARRKASPSAQSSVRFVVDPSLQWVFGRPAKGAFDSERGLVEYVLTFVNGDESAVEPDPAQASAHPLRQAEALARMRQDRREELRRFTRTFLSNRAAALRLVPEHLLVWHGITARFEAASAHFVFWVPVNSPDALRAFFVSMLADESRPFGRALCQCNLKGSDPCNRAFLEQKPATGRPQRLYCSRKHMLAAHAARER